MARFVFPTWYGAGNQVPAIGLAQELAARGHEVCFAGYRSQRARLEAHGFEFTLLRRADAGYRADEPPERVMAALLDGVWACPEHLADVADLLAGRCDALVVDCMMFGVLAAIETTRMPTAVLVHSAPGALLPPGGAGEALMLGPVNEVRRAAGRPPVANLWQAWAPFLTVCASIPDLDPQPAPPPLRYVGPVFERTAPSGWRSPWRADDTRPLVVASFSTGPAWDQTSRIARTLDALADTARYRVLALTSQADVGGLRAPENAVLLPYLPHAEVLPEAAVTVTHAGHGTVAAALAHGVPLVALPNPAADQPALAARVAELGAGLALDGESATVPDIADAVAAVLGDGSHRAAAAKLAETIAATPGAAGAADLVERLA